MERYMRDLIFFELTVTLQAVAEANMGWKFSISSWILPTFAEPLLTFCQKLEPCLR
jgi:hypothetical protein